MDCTRYVSYNRLTVIIPTREPHTLTVENNVTVRTLQEQTWRNFRIVVIKDTDGRGANWARNLGWNSFGQETEYVMFCDDDINWKNDALAKMIACIDMTPQASYVYCGYALDGRKISMQKFDRWSLMRYNYISTMSIIRTAHMPKEGFDESIKRFQDWDLWLTLLQEGRVGVWCGELLYSTLARNGITFGNRVTPEMADRAIREKHKWMKDERLQFIH